MAPKVDIIDNPYTRQLSILVDGKVLSAYSTLEKYMDEPFYYWCDKILPAIHEELNGNSFYFALKSEPYNLKIMEKICRENSYCLGFSGDSLSKSTPLTERMSKLNRLIQNNNLSGYRSFTHNAVFVVSEKYSELRNELLDISIDNVFCHVNVDAVSFSDYTYRESENESVFIICDKSDVEKMYNRTGIRKGFVLSVSDNCEFVQKKNEVFFFDTTTDSLFNSIFDCFKLTALNEIFFRCVSTLSYDIKEDYRKELIDITGTSPTVIPKPESLNIEVGSSVCIKFESDVPGLIFNSRDLLFSYSCDGVVKCDGVRMIGLSEGKTKMYIFQKGEIQSSAELEFICIKRNRIDSIEMSDKQLFIGYGDTADLEYSIWPMDADNEDEISFISDNESIVRVSEDGTIYGAGNGTCSVWVTAGNVSDSCVVSVLPHMSKIIFPESELFINPGERISIAAQTVPEMCIDNRLDFSCIDIRVANVANSTLIGVSCGDTRLVIQNFAENLRIDIPVHVGYNSNKQETTEKRGFLKRLFG